MKLDTITNKSLLLIIGTHTICCVVPVLMFLIGVTTTFQFTNFIHEYKWYVYGLNLLLIGFGFYSNYLHKSKDKSCSHNKCEKQKRTYLYVSVFSIVITLLSLFVHTDQFNKMIKKPKPFGTFNVKK